jgi:signal transduction histidine kinase
MSGAALERSRILVVDDDPMNVYILREVLGGTYDVHAAETGAQALEIADEVRADLILLDIMMPDFDGYELCRRFRANPNLAFTKIILVSAKSMLRDRLEGYRAGADDYIVKPFDPEELRAKVQVFLRLKSVEEVERVKDDIINVFSHETRTPLNTIIGFSRLLEESPSLSASEREAIQHIRDCGMNLMELVDKTILLATLRKGACHLALRPVSLAGLIRTAEVKLDAAIAAKHLVVKVDVPGNLVFMADESLLVTALVLVMDNAIKFSPEGGALGITADRDERSVRLHVRDGGRGLPSEKLASLFNAFVVEDVTHHGQGHGLGLAIVKHVLRLHGGDISARNNPDAQGCTFTLALPLQRVINAQP